MTLGGTHASDPDPGAKPEPNRCPFVEGVRHEKVVAAPYVSIQTWGRRLALQWRDRCEAGGVAREATVGANAVALCEAVVRTLEDPLQAPNLAQAVRAWVGHGSPPYETGSALVFLGEVAAQLGEEVYPPEHLEPVLAQLLSQEPAASARAEPIEVVTLCSYRTKLEKDLASAVASAVADGSDVAVVTLGLDARRRSRTRGGLGAADDASALSLVAALRRMLGPAQGLYRMGDRYLAVLAPDTDRRALGELMLQATCASRSSFTWGLATLHAAGPQVAARPDLLLMLAEADRHLRRRDASRACSVGALRRRMTTVAGAAAFTVVAAGIGLGLTSTAGIPNARPQAAQTPHSRSAPSAPLPAPSAGLEQASSVLAPSPFLPASSITSSPPSPLPTSVVAPAEPTVMTFLPAPSLAVPPTLVSQPQPPPAPQPGSPAGGAPTSVPLHGQSASSPGHSKSHGNSAKHP